MTSEVARRYKFEAVHHIPGLPSPWGESHPHVYTIEVVAAGEATGDQPMVVDTAQLDGTWVRLRPLLESCNLNESLNGLATTVESLSEWLLEEFGDEVERVVSVTVWEDDERWGRATR